MTVTLEEEEEVGDRVDTKEEVCWMEKEGIEEKEAVTVKEEEKEEEDAFRVKEEAEKEDDAVFGVKEEEGEMTVTSKKEVEETGYLGPVSQTHLKASNCSNSELSCKMVLGNRALINTSKYCLQNRGSCGTDVWC
ncbi:cilia- and flagella-associated protein 251-like isoform X2 [Oncorhynchus kisutch]|uniref:cilia- and flagella-associated protein 251-like isoform X2 n=1 Tax=Oncorhynchus kisutch TaxID=8019 RepID=UPI0012DEDE8C|nr:cilia- and flagella-associated protein 251-like isoform X2 [Oncorhynchus kisutch]